MYSFSRKSWRYPSHRSHSNAVDREKKYNKMRKICNKMWIKKFGRIIIYVLYFTHPLPWRADQKEKRKKHNVLWKLSQKKIKEKKDIVFYRALFLICEPLLPMHFWGGQRRTAGDETNTKCITKRHHAYHVYVIRPESIHKHRALVIIVYENSDAGDRGPSPRCPLPRAY